MSRELRRAALQTVQNMIAVCTVLALLWIAHGGLARVASHEHDAGGTPIVLHVKPGQPPLAPAARTP